MPNTRTLDPSTSHAAEKSVNNLTKTKNAILEILAIPCADVELVDRYYAKAETGAAPNASPSGIRSRRSELVEEGRVVDSGFRIKLPSGRSAIVWKLTEGGH